MVTRFDSLFLTVCLCVPVSSVLISPAFAGYFLRSGGTGPIYEGQQAKYYYEQPSAPTGSIFGRTYPGYFRAGHVLIGADVYHHDYGVEPEDSGRMYISDGCTSFKKSVTFTFCQDGSFWPYSSGFAEWWFDDDLNNQSHYGGIIDLSASAAQQLQVRNLYPTITAISSDLEVGVDKVFSCSANATDPGKYDYLLYNWELDGDGRYDDLTGKSGQWSYSAPGFYTVGLRVTDGDGGHDSSSFHVTVVPELTGDVNEDGFVEQNDLDIVLAMWGKTGPDITDPRADINDDDFVGQTDLDHVLGEWGWGTPPMPLVPEPATLSLLGLASLALIRGRRQPGK